MQLTNVLLLFLTSLQNTAFI